jgi:hypothetical protein
MVNLPRIIISDQDGFLFVRPRLEELEHGI